MSLNSAMHIGASALRASQVGLQVTGNNLANVSTPGYSRQVVGLAPIQGQNFGAPYILGRGVGVTGVTRQISESLNARLRTGVSDESAARGQLDVLSQLESVLGELSGSDLSSAMDRFFGAWSELANLTESGAAVIASGRELAGVFHRISGDLKTLRAQVDRELGVSVTKAHELAQSVADLNRQIVASEVGSAKANGLRDQRDQVLSELSQLMDVSVVELGDGAMDVLVGSTPIVLGASARRLTLETETVDGVTRAYIAAGADGREIPIRSGRIGSMMDARNGEIDGALDRIDTLAARLIHEVNTLHATGSSKAGLTQATSQLAFPIGDRSLPLNSPENASIAGLPIKPTNGGFYIEVKDSSGQTTRTRINVDLDGITGAGGSGVGDDTTLEGLIASIDAVEGVSASFGPDGKLRINADSGYTFGFADDTSGVVGALGFNAYFTGNNASNMDVRADLSRNPGQLSIGRSVRGEFVANGTAMEIAGLREKPLDALGGASLRGYWQDGAQSIGVATQAARSNFDAAVTVRESLQAQRDSVSGVSIDEESINLLNFQRQYQGAARLIAVADELMQTLMSLV
ncbi:MAG: flagellar hook-associated protein FlgK [Phycisphaerales bacterium]|nr:flagellar hook-associated protein FlgK [Phycisphaerales bacterium]